MQAVERLFERYVKAASQSTSSSTSGFPNQSIKLKNTITWQVLNGVQIGSQVVQSLLGILCCIDVLISQMCCSQLQKAGQHGGPPSEKTTWTSTGCAQIYTGACTGSLWSICHKPVSIWQWAFLDR
jgi:hypothetical protein